MKKIGIITYHNSFNYGAVLQAYATQKILEYMKYDSYIINYENKNEKKENSFFSYKLTKPFINNCKDLIRNLILKSYSLRKKNFKKFSDNLRKTKKLKRLEDVQEEISSFDVIIAGSDQIWNPKICADEFEKVFFLDFKAKKKISYASSAGSYIFNEDEMEYLKKCLMDYSHISVREEFLKRQLENNGIKDISIVADPTLLITKEQWRKDCYDSSIIKDIPKEFILVFLLQPYNEFCKNIIKTFKEKYHIPIVHIGFSTLKKEYMDINLTNVTPERFVALIDNAKFVITDSFHGHAFSFNMNTNFFTILNPNNPKRIENFLKKFGLENRIIKDTKDIDNIDVEIDYKKCREQLEDFRMESLKFLKNSIEN